jgi:glucose/arabinose dehydrogenase
MDLPRLPALPVILAAAALTALGVAARSPRADAAISSAEAPEVELVPLETGLPALTSIAHAGDSRLFLTEQAGRIVIWDGISVLPTPFLDVTALVSCCQERGLLSVAFHPRYAQTGFFFVDYTDTAGDTVVARYRVSSSDPDRADPASAVVLLHIRQPFANHNGGELQFGPNGYLYVGMGDGGSANDPMCNAQNDASLLGKLLRIDVDSAASSPPFYSVPPDNPFRPGGGAPSEAWAKGLRNPWRFSFDRATGDLWIGDVGQDAREEIDMEPKGSAGGRNYGWKLMEGTICGAGGSAGCASPGPPPCGSPAYTAPVLEYPHAGGDCSVTGGYVYRGSEMPDFLGGYFYGDFCTGRLRVSGRELAARAPNLSTFGEDVVGELYLATTDGLFARLREAGVTPTPTPVRVPIAPVTPPTRRPPTPRSVPPRQ